MENAEVLCALAGGYYESFDDLNTQGEEDQRRHKEKIREAVKENLPSIVSEEAIITSDGDKLVKIPIRNLDLPRFRYDEGKREQVGQGDGNSKVGDVIGQQPGQQGSGRGKGAGNEPGIDYYEAEITIDELTAILFEELGLPYLKPKQVQNVETDDVRFKEINKHGIMSNLDKRRTVIETIRRNARAGGEPIFTVPKPEDMRFKTWAPEKRPEANAVVIAMRDVSASMGEFEKYISRSFYFWMVKFLRQKYNLVDIVFITHHTEAKEVDEQTFFRLGESGGTRVSSAYQLALDIMRERYSSQRWNVYPFHFSDGDNWGEADNKRCLELVQTMLETVSLFGYGEIHESRMPQLSTLLATFKDIKNENFRSVTISDKRGVYPALKTFFNIKDTP